MKKKKFAAKVCMNNSEKWWQFIILIYFAWKNELSNSNALGQLNIVMLYQNTNFFPSYYNCLFVVQWWWKSRNYEATQNCNGIHKNSTSLHMNTCYRSTALWFRGNTNKWHQHHIVRLNLHDKIDHNTCNNRDYTYHFNRHKIEANQRFNSLSSTVSASILYTETEFAFRLLTISKEFMTLKEAKIES